jgi:hypothetical protein
LINSGATSALHLDRKRCLVDEGLGAEHDGEGQAFDFVVVDKVPPVQPVANDRDHESRLWVATAGLLARA